MSCAQRWEYYLNEYIQDTIYFVICGLCIVEILGDEWFRMEKKMLRGFVAGDRGCHCVICIEIEKCVDLHFTNGEEREIALSLCEKKGSAIVSVRCGICMFGDELI